MSRQSEQVQFDHTIFVNEVKTISTSKDIASIRDLQTAIEFVLKLKKASSKSSPFKSDAFLARVPSANKSLELRLAALSGNNWILELSNLYLQHLVSHYDGSNSDIQAVEAWLQHDHKRPTRPYPLNLNANEPKSFEQWMDFYVKLSVQLHLKIEFELGEIRVKELFIMSFEYFSKLFTSELVAPTLLRLMPFYLLSDLLVDALDIKDLKHLIVDKKNELSQILNRVSTLEQTVLEQDFLLDKYKEETDRALDLKSKFLNNMSHEIRTPMTTIFGYSELLLKHNDNPNRVKDFAEVIQTNAASLMDLMDDFIEISKLESGIARPFVQRFRFSELFEFQIDVSPLFPANSPVQLNIQIERTISELIEGDKDKIIQILIHLVENARRFTSEGDVSVYFDIDRRDAMINLKVSENSSKFELKDTNEIFEEFYYLEHDRHDHSSTSLGLSIVKRLVNLLDGTIRFQPKKTGGSEIFVQLPIEIISKSKMLRVTVPRSERRTK